MRYMYLDKEDAFGSILKPEVQQTWNNVAGAMELALFSEISKKSVSSVSHIMRLRHKR